MKSFLIVESREDPASVAIATALRSSVPWTTARALAGLMHEQLGDRPDVHLVSTDRPHLQAEPLEQDVVAAGLRPEAIIFLSKHKAASGQRALTVHPVGNIGQALYGGQAGRLSPCLPALQSELLRALAEGVKEAAYPAEVTFEATHHGPLLSTPACFLELGSGPEHWSDPAGADVVARALLKVLSRPLPRFVSAIGLGGGHYAPRFTEAALSQQVHFGHMIPTHGADHVPDSKAMLRQALDTSVGAKGVYFHRKVLPRPVLDAWRQAAREEGIPLLDSADWPSLAAPVKEMHR